MQHCHPPARGLLSLISLLRAFLLTGIKRNQAEPNHQPSIHAAESSADGGALGLPRVPLGPRWEARRPHVSWVFLGGVLFGRVSTTGRPGWHRAASKVTRSGRGEPSPRSVPSLVGFTEGNPGARRRDRTLPSLPRPQSSGVVTRAVRYEKRARGDFASL